MGYNIYPKTVGSDAKGDSQGDVESDFLASTGRKHSK